jgi:peroxiredoxin Q/BCP
MQALRAAIQGGTAWRLASPPRIPLRFILAKVGTSSFTTVVSCNGERAGHTSDMRDAECAGLLNGDDGLPMNLSTTRRFHNTPRLPKRNQNKHFAAVMHLSPKKCSVAACRCCRISPESDQTGGCMTAVAALSLPMTCNQTFDTAALKGTAYVLYFYPKDNTPGCTTEGADFRDQHEAFLAAGAKVFGVSRDSLNSHENFKAKMAFPFELVSDPDEMLCEAFGVMKMKNMYGKQVRGVERSTFVIDAQGNIVKEWRGVKVPGHVSEVLAFVQGMK